jgi:hypothetical protein
VARLVTNGLNLNNQRIVSLADPSSATDATTKQYVDNLVSGLSPKDSVRAATTANGALATAFENGDTVDGVTLATGDRILIKNQSTGSENGIYTVNASGAPTRATDFDSSSEIRGAIVAVEEGTVNGDTLWICTTNAPITVGTTSLSFTQWTSGITYTAGAGLTLSGSTFNVGAGTGITVNADDVAIDSTYSGLAKRYASAIGDGSTTDIVVTHNLGTRDVAVTVYDAASPYAEVDADVEHTSTNTVTVKFATAPASGAYRAVVLG